MIHVHGIHDACVCVCERETYIRNYGAVALDDVRAVVALQHHVQVHQDPLVLVLVSGPPHLLVTHTHTTSINI